MLKMVDVYPYCVNEASAHLGKGLIFFVCLLSETSLNSV